MSRLHVDPARADELIAAFQGRMHGVDEFDGFVGLEVWHSDRDPSEVLMVSRWRDREAFSAYMRSEVHRASHARVAADLDDAVTLARLDHLHTYDIVAH